MKQLILRLVQGYKTEQYGSNMIFIEHIPLINDDVAKLVVQDKLKTLIIIFELCVLCESPLR